MDKITALKMKYYILGVLVTTGLNAGVILTIKLKLAMRIKRSNAFLAESEKIMAEFRACDKDDREKQNEISQRYIDLLELYGL